MDNRCLLSQSFAVYTNESHHDQAARPECLRMAIASWP